MSSTKITQILLALGFSIFILIPLSLSLYQTLNQEEKPKDDINATMINIYGKTDKRLKLKFISTYRPTYSNNACKKYQDINTATKRIRLKTGTRIIENRDEYNITIPVYNKDMRSKCEYEFVGISVRVERLYERGGLYAIIPILSDKPYFIGEGTKTGQSSSGNSFHAEMRKKYFRIPNGKKVSCFTKFYERGGMITKTSSSFICDLNFRNEIEGVQKIQNDSINLDIIVDKNRCRYLFKERYISIYHYKKGNMSAEEMKLFDSKQKQFKMPETLIHIKIKNLFTGDDNE